MRALDGRAAGRAGREVVEQGLPTRSRSVFIPYTHYTRQPARDRQGRRADGRAARSGRRRRSTSWSTSTAGRRPPRRRSHYIEALAPGRPLFVEEPLPPGETPGLAADRRPRRRCRSLPASGWSTAASSTTLFRARAVDIAQPDICHVGGCCEAKKIAAMAETAGYRRGAAQSARADRRRRRAAFRRLDAQLRHPGGDGRARCPGTTRWCSGPIAHGRRLLAGARKCPGWASRSTRRSPPSTRSSRRSCTPATPCCPTAPWWTGDAMAGRLQDKIAIVTGAGQGIGEATARALAAQGAKVVVAEMERRRPGAAIADRSRAGGGAVRRDRRDRARRSCRAMVAARTLEAYRPRSTSWSTMPAPTCSTSRWRCPTRSGGAASRLDLEAAWILPRRCCRRCWPGAPARSSTSPAATASRSSRTPSPIPSPSTRLLGLDAGARHRICRRRACA